MLKDSQEIRQPKNVLITGASSGIGEALAFEFAKNNYNLVLIARNEEKLKIIEKEIKEEYDVNVIVIVKNLADETSCIEIKNELKKMNVEINVLVNNAGVGRFGTFVESDLTENENMINLNILTVVRLTYIFLEEMLARNEGSILNIASIASFYPGPLMATYYATKAFVLSFSESLSREIKGSKVNVTTFCPGLTKTDFLIKAKVENENTSNFLVEDVEKVAQKAYLSMKKKKKVVISGIYNKLFIFMIRFMPRSLITSISYTMQRTRIIKTHK